MLNNFFDTKISLALGSLIFLSFIVGLVNYGIITDFGEPEKLNAYCAIVAFAIAITYVLSLRPRCDENNTEMSKKQRG